MGMVGWVDHRFFGGQSVDVCWLLVADERLGGTGTRDREIGVETRRAREAEEALGNGILDY